MCLGRTWILHTTRRLKLKVCMQVNASCQFIRYTLLQTMQYSINIFFFFRYDCEKIWDTFTQAYVGRDPCKVPAEAYGPLFAAAPFKPACNRVNTNHHITCLI